MRHEEAVMNMKQGTAKRWFQMLLALAFLLPAMSAFGQFESASVLGYARDGSGAALPNAMVTLTNTQTGTAQKANTDSEGKFEFPSVAIGQYQVKG